MESGLYTVKIYALLDLALQQLEELADHVPYEQEERICWGKRYIAMTTLSVFAKGSDVDCLYDSLQIDRCIWLRTGNTNCFESYKQQW